MYPHFKTYTLCPRCAAGNETVSHVVLECSIALDVWGMNMFGALWWSRNKLIHENIRQTSRDVTWVHAYTQEIDSLISVEQKPTHRPCVKWNRPGESYVRVNFDAVFLQQNHQSFVGIIIPDHNGLVLGSCSMKNDYILDSFIAEARAAIQALQFAADMGFTNVEIEGDSRTVISKISSRNLDRSSIDAVEKRR
ncbi:reverse transcriptase [Gossypium australe]|uniref:Reverse transcriptase n=1 Tax=Gossypium australe TaxID=47621 RepID=A0A5B6W5B6_9ROSI|nr:reverse transcriptase [Gossypium australe]